MARQNDSPPAENEAQGDQGAAADPTSANAGSEPQDGRQRAWWNLDGAFHASTEPAQPEAEGSPALDGDQDGVPVSHQPTGAMAVGGFRVRLNGTPTVTVAPKPSPTDRMKTSDTSKTSTAESTPVPESTPYVLPPAELLSPAARPKPFKAATDHTVGALAGVLDKFSVDAEVSGTGSGISLSTTSITPPRPSTTSSSSRPPPWPKQSN